MAKQRRRKAVSTEELVNLIDPLPKREQCLEERSQESGHLWDPSDPFGGNVAHEAPMLPARKPHILDWIAFGLDPDLIKSGQLQ